MFTLGRKPREGLCFVLHLVEMSTIAISLTGYILALAPLLDLAFLWHHCLSHYSAWTLSSFRNSHLISFPNKTQDSCTSCGHAKSLGLPFQSVEHCYDTPLYLIQSDIWQSLVLSHSGYWYYICFVNDFSRILGFIH